MDFAFGADVDAARRLVEQKYPRPVCSQRVITTFR